MFQVFVFLIIILVEYSETHQSHNFCRSVNIFLDFVLIILCIIQIHSHTSKKSVNLFLFYMKLIHYLLKTIDDWIRANFSVNCPISFINKLIEHILLGVIKKGINNLVCIPYKAID